MRQIPRGTRVKLLLRPEALEFAREDTLRALVRKTHKTIEFPIKARGVSIAQWNGME